MVGGNTESEIDPVKHESSIAQNTHVLKKFTRFYGVESEHEISQIVNGHLRSTTCQVSDTLRSLNA